LIDDPVRVAAAEELAEEDEDVALPVTGGRREVTQRVVGHGLLRKVSRETNVAGGIS
jgi:hypothetical protein